MLRVVVPVSRSHRNARPALPESAGLVLCIALLACDGGADAVDTTTDGAAAATAEAGVAARDAGTADARVVPPAPLADAQAVDASTSSAVVPGDSGALALSAGDAGPPDAGRDGGSLDAGRASDGGSRDASTPADAGAAGPTDSGVASAKACILPLGDSITASDGSHLGYRYWLWDSLTRAKYSVDMVGSIDGKMKSHPIFPDPNFDADNEGYPGYQTAQVLALLPGVLPKYGVSYALIHLGTNDVVFRTNSPQDVTAQLGQIIDLLRAKNPDVAVLLAQIIPSTWQGAAQRVPPYNAQ
ncbi:MAG TPA: GDSL-type esterase/lipase family protein, partial [Polyangiales bacterium]|nr:GDSL-type esterase/lipase family protein [Polyangiales bacterium]